MSGWNFLRVGFSGRNKTCDLGQMSQLLAGFSKKKKTNECLKAPGWPKPCQKRVHGGSFYGLVVLPPQHGMCNPACRNVVQAGLMFGKFALRWPAGAGNAACRSLAASVSGSACLPTHSHGGAPVAAPHPTEYGYWPFDSVLVVCEWAVQSKYTETHTHKSLHSGHGAVPGGPPLGRPRPRSGSSREMVTSSRHTCVYSAFYCALDRAGKGRVPGCFFSPRGPMSQSPSNGTFFPEQAVWEFHGYFQQIFGPTWPTAMTVEPARPPAIERHPHSSSSLSS